MVQIVIVVDVYGEYIASSTLKTWCVDFAKRICVVAATHV